MVPRYALCCSPCYLPHLVHWALPLPKRGSAASSIAHPCRLHASGPPVHASCCPCPPLSSSRRHSSSSSSRRPPQWMPRRLPPHPPASPWPMHSRHVHNTHLSEPSAPAVSDAGPGSRLQPMSGDVAPSATPRLPHRPARRASCAVRIDGMSPPAHATSLHLPARHPHLTPDVRSALRWPGLLRPAAALLPIPALPMLCCCYFCCSLPLWTPKYDCGNSASQRQGIPRNAPAPLRRSAPPAAVTGPPSAAATHPRQARGGAARRQPCPTLASASSSWPGAATQ